MQIRIPDGPLAPIMVRAAEIAKHVGQSLTDSGAPPDQVPDYAVLAGMFVGLALYAEDDDTMTVLRAWTLTTGTGNYSNTAHYILTGEQPEEVTP